MVPIALPALAGLAVYGGGLLACVGWRCWRQYRTTGDAGLRAPRHQVGSAGWWAGASLAVALLIGLAGLVVAAVAPSSVLGAPLIAGPATAVVGLVVAVVGIAATLVAQGGMGRSWRIGVDETERTDLVATGVFAWSRNPIFTAMVVIQLGVTLAVPTPPIVVAAAVLVVALELQVRVVEEPYLERVHGEAYRRYATRVGRFLPGIGRAPARPER